MAPQGLEGGSGVQSLLETSQEELALKALPWPSALKSGLPQPRFWSPQTQEQIRVTCDTFYEPHGWLHKVNEGRPHRIKASCRELAAPDGDG